MRRQYNRRSFQWVIGQASLTALILCYATFVSGQNRGPSLNEIAKLAANKQWQSAATQISRYRTLHSDSVEAAILEADIVIHIGLLADARDILQRILAVHPHSIDALTAYADLSEDLRDKATAEQLLLRCTRYAPTNSATWLRSGEFYLRNGRKEALSAFQHVLEISPHNASAIAGIAEFHHQRAEDVAALREFRQAESWNKNVHAADATVDLRFGDFLADKENYSESLKHYQRAVDLNPSLGEARLGCAKDNIHLQRWTEAEEDLKITSATDEWKIESLNMLIRVYQAQGRTQETQNVASQVEHLSEELNDEKAKRNQIATALQNARALQEHKRFDEATKAYEALVQKQPDAQAAWMNLGQCYASLKRSADAQRAFQHAIELVPESPQTRVQFGKVLLQEHKTQEARKEFTQALDVDPLFSDAQVGIAASFMFEQDYKDAIDALEKAKSIPRAGIDPRLMLTEAFFKNGQRELATREINEALSKYPGDKQALAMRNSLRSPEH